MNIERIVQMVEVHTGGEPFRIVTSGADLILILPVRTRHRRTRFRPVTLPTD